jgi:lipopolysaccharide export LptBFGC system permease protein LptF
VYYGLHSFASLEYTLLIKKKKKKKRSLYDFAFAQRLIYIMSLCFLIFM